MFLMLEKWIYFCLQINYMRIGKNINKYIRIREFSYIVMNIS
jgi:hypothetical protein